MGGFMTNVRAIGGRVDRDKRNGRDDLSRLEPKFIDGTPPPHDLDAEAAVLSAAMIDSPRVADLLWLKPRHFYSEAHGRVWEAIIFCHVSGVSADVVTVGTRLKDTDRIAQVGGMSFLTQLLAAAPAVSNVDKYARIVVEKARARNFIARAQQIAAEGYTVDDVRAWIATSEASILEVSRDASSSLRYKSLAELRAPIPTELPWLIEELRIIQGRANMFAGFPFSGKTLIAQDVGLSTATGKRVFGLWRPRRTGIVSHLNYDQPWLDTQIRYSRLMWAKGVREEELLDDRGRLLLRVYQYPEAYLDRDEHIAEIRGIMRESVLVIIDALTGAVEDTEENSPAMGKLIYRLNKLSEETGCTVLIIHHAKKTQQGRPRPKEDEAGKIQDLMQMIRGSSSIFGAVGSAFVLEPTGRKKPVLMHHVKTPALSADTIDTFGIRFVDVDEDREDLNTGERVFHKHAGVNVQHLDPEQLAELARAEKKKTVPDDAAAFDAKCNRVLEVVKKEPGLSGAEIKVRLSKMSKDSVYAALKALAKRQPPAVASEKGPRGAEFWRAV